MILLRFSGELATKARATRSRFEQRLLHNLRAALEAVGIAASVERRRERYYVHTGEPAALEALGCCFGIQSAALTQVTAATNLAGLVAEGVRRCRERVAGKRFAIRARRVGPRELTPISARAVESALGDALRPSSAGVDLGNPEVRIPIEIQGDRAFWIEREVAGPGGLPLAVQGRGVALLSGGFDSAVAAWQILRRGVDLDLVFCNLGGQVHLLGALGVAKALVDRWCHGVRPTLHAIDFDAVARDIRRAVERRYWQVVLKRQMLRAAERVARECGAEAIVTGEALGQVSSQTLANLATISRATDLPILRPLVGTNKDAIVRAAEAIGTAQLSAAVGEYCAMVPHKPATAARPDAIAREERNLEGALLEAALESRARFDLRELHTEAQGDASLAADEIAPGSTVIDLRSKAGYQGWHYPGALHLDFDRALAAYGAFDPDARYVVYCEVGIKSAHLAECMRERGLDARHVPGGLRGVVRLARERGHAGPDWIAADRVAEHPTRFETS